VERPSRLYLISVFILAASLLGELQKSGYAARAFLNDNDTPIHIQIEDAQGARIHESFARQAAACLASDSPVAPY